MPIETKDDLRALIISAGEGERLEFKEAKASYNKEKLCEYVSALANEGGGALVLGVTDLLPRTIVGTGAFSNLDDLKRYVFAQMNWRVHPQEFDIDGKRVLVIETRGRPQGKPLAANGRYWMRVGSELRNMTSEELRFALSDAPKDFSAEICAAASINDLSPEAISEFRARWQRKEPTTNMDAWSAEEILENAELTIDGAITYAALVLMGTRKALGRHLPQAELVFEFRNRISEIDYADRVEFREGFLRWQDNLVEKINSRNEVQQFQSGLFRYDVRTFEEETIREAILNAICHRDYSEAGSAWVRMTPRIMDIESPGGFPRGVTAENILDRQNPRNRRLAEALRRCGLVERSGQGADRMFRQAIRDAKPLPDFSGTDQHRVLLRLSGEITDPKFLAFLESVGNDRLQIFTTSDFLALDYVRRGEILPEPLKARLPSLRAQGIVERIGRGKFILSRKFQTYLGKAATYTREKGLDRGAEKELLVKHLTHVGTRGAPIGELMEVLPDRSREHVKALLRELRGEGRARIEGSKRLAKWLLPFDSHEVAG